MSYAPPQQGGAANSYYQQGQQDIGMQQQQGQASYQQQPEQPQQDPQQPPQYGQQPNAAGGEKEGFEQKFQVDRLKFNDIWAALLFLATFAGFVAVSGLSIYGYSASKGGQGGGIYNSGTTAVALNTNTIIIL
jgi:hypothetical protein